MKIVQTCMTEENNWLREFILANFNHDKIVAVYGRFEIPEGYFSLGKRPDGLYAFFKNFNGVNSCDTFETLEENNIKKLLEGVNLVPNKIEEPKEEPKTKSEPLTLFDFM